MKDARGHGSEKRGGVGPSNRDAADHVMRALAAAHSTRPITRHGDQPSVGTDEA